MKLIHEMDLSKQPFHLKFNYGTYSDSPNFYHTHQGIEMIYVHAGQGDVLVNRKVYEVRPHTLFLFQPYQLHRIRMNVTPSVPYIRSKFLLEPSSLDERLANAPGLQSFFRQLWKREIAQPVIYGLDGSVFMTNLMSEYEARFRLPLSAAERQEESLLFLMQWFRCLKNDWHDDLLGGEPSPKAREHHHAENVIHWLESHMTEPLELDRIADELHVTKHHLSRLFKRATGSTISEYMTVIRVQRACRLLETTDRPVERISHEVGIGNTSYFCEMFKKAMGHTPLQYRLFLARHP